jgi:hypothetical protein
VTIPTHRAENSALGKYSCGRLAIVKTPNQRHHGVVVDTALDSQRSLAHRREETLGLEYFRDATFEAETYEPGSREDRGIAVPAVDLRQARVYIPSQWHDVEIRSRGSQSDGTPWARRPDSGPLGQAVEREVPRRDERVPWILSLWDDRQNETRSERCRNVFYRMDGEVRAAIEQRLLDLLYK